MDDENISVEALRCLHNNLMLEVAAAVARFEHSSGCKVEGLVRCKDEEEFVALRRSSYTVADHKKFGAYPDSLVYARIRI